MSDDVVSAGEETRRHVRGSSILLVGRTLSLGLNFATQVLIVRHLAQGEFGAFAYGLAVVEFARTAISLGHQRIITRFFSLFDETRRYDKLFGTILMEIGMVVVLGGIVVTGLWTMQGSLDRIVGDDLTRDLLLIVIFLAPIDAADKLIESLFAVFARPAAIFVRKYVVAPLLRLSVVVLLLATGAGVRFLAVGYVVASAAGLLLYVGLLVHTLRRRGLLDHFDRRHLELPFREVFRFALPLITVDFVYLSIETGSVIVLERLGSTDAVAAYRAAFPAARANSMVMWSFTLLYVPVATRLHARRDAAGLHEHYWRNAVWLAVLTFPVAALTIPLAEPIAVAMLGERYASSAPVLAMLAGGTYLNAVFGFNALTLQLAGRLRFTVVVNLLATAGNLVLSLALARDHGALGVAAANLVTFAFHNVANQYGLRRVIGKVLPAPRHLLPFVLLAAGLGGLWAFELALDPGAVVSVLVAAVVSVGILVASRHSLDIADSFPELTRVPLLRWLFAPSTARVEGRGPDAKMSG